MYEIFGEKRTGYMVEGNYITHPNTVRAIKIAIAKGE